MYNLKVYFLQPTKKKKKLKTKKERDRVRSLKDEPKKPAAADRPVSVRIKRSKPALVVKRNIVTENIVAVTHKKTVVFLKKINKTVNI